MRKLLPLIWRGNTERYRLMGSVCESCGSQFFPQRKICPNCRRKGKLVPKKMPDEGKIVSFSLVHSAPTGFELEAPYHLALIELDNGVRLLSQIADSPVERVVIGARVKRVFRKIFEDDSEGAIAYGYKFMVVQDKEKTSDSKVHESKPSKAKGKK